jgi:hypothetical protein
MKTKTIKARALYEAEFSIKIDTSHHDHASELHYEAYEKAEREASEFAKLVNFPDGHFELTDIQIIDETF